MSAHTRPPLHNEKLFPVYCDLSRAITSLSFFIFPEVLTAPKMHGMLYISLYKGHKWETGLMYCICSPWTQPHSKHNHKRRQQRIIWNEFIGPIQFCKSTFCNLSFFFRADLLLPLKQLPFLVKRSSTLFFLTALPFHYFDFFLCSVLFFFY